MPDLDLVDTAATDETTIHRFVRFTVVTLLALIVVVGYIGTTTALLAHYYSIATKLQLLLAYLTWIGLVVLLALGLVVAYKTEHIRDVELVAEPIQSARASIRPPILSSFFALRSTSIPWLLLLASIALIYGRVTSPGIPLSGDWVYLGPRSALSQIVPFPSLWSYGSFGSDNTNGIFTYPLWVLLGLFAKLHVSYALSERLLFLLPSVLASAGGVMIMGRQLGVVRIASALFSVYYTSNTYYIDWYSGGWSNIVLGYSLLPWLVVFITAFYRTRHIKWLLSIGLLLGIISWCDPRELIMTVIAVVVIAGVYIVRPRPFALVVSNLKGSLLVGLILVTLEAPVLILLMAGARPTIPHGYETAGALQTFSFMNIFDSMSTFDPWWPRMSYFHILSNAPAVWIIVIAFPLTLILSSPHDRRGLAAIGVYLVFSMLTSGTNGYFRPINQFLFTTIPGMSYFRYPALYEQYVTLAIAYIAAIVSSNYSRVRKRPSIQPRQGRNRHYVGTEVLLYGTLSSLIVFSAWSTIMGPVKGMLDPIPREPSVQHVEQWLSSHPSGAAIWIPVLPGLARQDVVTYEGIIHPNISAENVTTILNGSNVVYSGTPFAWTYPAVRLRSVVAQYGIRYVIVSTATSSYGSLGNDSRDVIANLRGAGFRKVQSYGSYEIFSTFINYGTVSIESRTDLHSNTFGVTSSTHSRPSSSPLRTLVTMGDFGPVYNSDNYARLNNVQSASAIGESLHGSGTHTYMRLHARSGAATVATTLPLKHGTREYNLQYRYLLSGPGVLRIDIFSHIEGYLESEYIDLTPTGGTWRNGSTDVWLGSGVHSRVTITLFSPNALERGRSLASAALGTMSFVTTNPYGSASTRSEARLNPQVDIFSNDWHGLLPIPSHQLVVTIPAHSNASVLGYLQSYNKGWVATSSSDGQLPHFELSGWANGYRLPPSNRIIHVTLVFQPQRRLEFGMAALYLSCFIVCTMILILHAGSFSRRST